MALICFPIIASKWATILGMINNTYFCIDLFTNCQDSQDRTTLHPISTEYSGHLANLFVEISPSADSAQLRSCVSVANTEAVSFISSPVYSSYSTNPRDWVDQMEFFRGYCPISFCFASPRILIVLARAKTELGEITKR